MERYTTTLVAGIGDYPNPCRDDDDDDDDDDDV
jgi:hypothetical protein